MKIRNLAYKPGKSFTSRESRLQNRTFIYKVELLSYKWDSRVAIYRIKKYIKKSTYQPFTKTTMACYIKNNDELMGYTTDDYRKEEIQKLVETPNRLKREKE